MAPYLKGWPKSRLGIGRAAAISVIGAARRMCQSPRLG
jgi:hypothetical protein